MLNPYTIATRRSPHDGLSFPPEEEGEDGDREDDRAKGDRIHIRHSEGTAGDRGDVGAGVFNRG